MSNKVDDIRAAHEREREGELHRGGKAKAVGRRGKIAGVQQRVVVLYKRRAASYLLRQSCDVPRIVHSETKTRTTASILGD